MKIAEIRELSDKELAERIDAQAAQLNQMIINHSITPLESPASITKARREIARMKTVLHQRSLNN